MDVFEEVNEKRIQYMTEKGEYPTNIKLHKNQYEQLRKELPQVNYLYKPSKPETLLGMKIDMLEWNGNDITMWSE